jgi:hypothetical protein
MTYEQAERAARDGRICEQTWRWYQFFWVWTAPRFSNVACAEFKQERAYARLGADNYYRRFERVKVLRARLTYTPSYTEVDTETAYGSTQRISRSIRVY